MATQIKLRRDTYQNWYDNDPVLAEGEPGFDLTNSKLKIGDGSTPWQLLPYFDDKENVYTNIASNIIPSTDSTYSLGSPSKRWTQMFVDNGAIYLGDIKITNDSGRLVVQQVTNPGLQTEAPVATPGIVTTDRIINGEHYFSINSNGDLFLDGVAYTELPTQTNNAGKFLTTNGSGTLSWSSSTGNTGDFVFTDGSASLPLGDTMTLNTYQNGGNGESKLTLSPTTESNLYVANILKLGVNYGSGSEKYWQFGADGGLTFPDASVQSTAYTGIPDRIVNGLNSEFVVDSNGALTNNYSYTKTTSPSISGLATSAVIWTSSENFVSGAKLQIQVEADEVGDNTGWHSQVCEAIIASRGYAQSASGPFGDPAMTVYGVTHTSTVPLVTFTVQRNPVTKDIEVVGTLTAAAIAATLRIYSVETATRD